MDEALVTGIGFVSPAGADPDALWRRLESGKPAWSSDACGAPVGRVDRDQVDYRSHVERKQQKLVNERSSLGVAAAGAALRASRVLEAGFGPEDVGVFSAGAVSAHGGTADSMRRRLRRLGPDATPVSKHLYAVYSVLRDPIDLLRGMVSAPQDHIAVRNDFRGATCTYMGGSVAGLMALGQAVRWVRHGRQKAMIVIATDMLVQRFTRRCLRMLGDEVAEGGEAAGDPARGEAPLGYVPAEGAAAVVIESERAARERSAPIYARVGGSAVRQLSPERADASIARAIQAALRAGDRGAVAVGSIFASANGPRQRRAEERAIRATFGEGAPDRISTRRIVGELGAAAGLFDVAVASLALRSGFWPGAGASAGSGDVLVNALGEGEAASVLLERA